MLVATGVFERDGRSDGRAGHLLGDDLGDPDEKRVEAPDVSRREPDAAALYSRKPRVDQRRNTREQVAIQLANEVAYELVLEPLEVEPVSNRAVEEALARRVGPLDLAESLAARLRACGCRACHALLPGC